MLIDCHMHMFPERLAPGTLDHLSKVCGTKPNTDGTLGGALDFIRQAGVDLGVALHIATSPKSQRNVNNFALECQEQSAGKLLSFGSVHPDAPDALEELRRIRDMGLRGVKLHPDYQHFYFQDARCYPIYEEMASLGLALTIHAGFDPLSPNDIHAPAAAVARVARDFPNLTIIAAHMGGLGYGATEESGIFGLENVWFDTAVLAVCYKGQEKRFAEHARRHGVERVLFGTDCPWDTVENTRAFIERAGLTSRELEMIYGENAKRLFHLA